MMKHIKLFESIDDISNLKGWVNIKIDDQLYIRMSRYVSALDTLIPRVRDRYDLYKKIEMISNIDKHMDKNSGVPIQIKISIITLLQYLNELKNQFNASSAGFLLEGFLACLIHGYLPPSGTNGVSDISGIGKSYSEFDSPRFKTESLGGRGIRKLEYQIKLYKDSGTIKINFKKLCDYYVICLKTGDVINVHILSMDPNDTESFIGKYLVKPRDVSRNTIIDDMNIDILKDDKGFVSLNINIFKNKGHKSIKLDIKDSTINELINKCGKNIKKSIEKVYTNLSDLHYDVDSIITGYDKNKARVTVDTAKRNCDITLKNISSNIVNLKSNII